MTDTTVTDRTTGGGAPAPVRGVLAVDRDVHARRAWLLLGAGAFQVWLWVTRLVNLAQDPTPRTTGFVVVHAVLYVAAFGVAGLLLAIGWRMRREARRRPGDTGDAGDGRVP